MTLTTSMPREPPFPEAYVETEGFNLIDGLPPENVVVPIVKGYYKLDSTKSGTVAFHFFENGSADLSADVTVTVNS